MKVKPFLKTYSVEFFLFIFLFLNYLIFKNKISWGGDYASYLLQAKAIFSGTLSTEVDLNKYLIGLSEKLYAPISYPIGFSIFQAITSPLHNWQFSLLKLINPVSLFLISAVTYKMFPKNNLKLVFIFPFLPFISKQNLDILPDIPAILFFCLSLFQLKKEKFNLSFIFMFLAIAFKNYFAILLIFHFIYLYNQKKIRNFFLGLFFIFLTKILGDFYFQIDILGNYSNTLNILSLFEINLNRMSYVISDLGYFITFVNNPFNIFIGFLIIIFLIFNIKNIYSLTALIYILFFLFFKPDWSHTDYKRYLLPAVYILFIILFDKLGKNQKDIFKVSFLIYFLFIIFMNFVIWQDLNRQRGPFTQEFSEVVEYVNSDIENGAMVSFHSPRVVRYLTNKNVFRKDKLVNFEHYEICEKILNSCTEGNKLFENDKFEIVFIQER